MATMGIRENCSVPNTNPNSTIGGNPNVSLYEKCREDRIKENLQRMQNLGILDLSLKLKSEIRPVKRSYGKSNAGCKSIRDTPPLQPSSTRRSSRLKDVTPVTYCEEIQVRKGKSSKREEEWFLEGERPEIYTEEHEKLLGNTDREWELFVDGYDKDGKRIYDPIRGKTCHQCRQKTLGYRTECSQCNMVQGQFCGDCLYMRYGEHVLEALENPDWICPACRGICNCSLCRKHKGWLPTGAAYRKISKLGYKSVAHYLIQTKRSETNGNETETETDATVNQASAKRSLSFQASEEQQGSELQDNLNSPIKLLEFFPSEDNQASVIDNQVIDELKPQENLSKTVIKVEDFSDIDDAKTPDESCKKETGQKSRLRTSSCVIDEQVTPLISARKENQERRSKRRVTAEPNPDSIGGRLRQRRKSRAFEITEKA